MWKATRRMLAGYWNEFVKTSVLTHMPEWTDAYGTGRMEAGRPDTRMGAGAGAAEDASAGAAAIGAVLPDVESSEKIVQETPGNV
jgi:hypothetical protein